MTDETVKCSFSIHVVGHISLLLLVKIFITLWTERQERGVLSALNTKQHLKSFLKVFVSLSG